MVRDIRLESLRLENVRGIGLEKLEFGGRSGFLRGPSGVGKSTVKAAFRWLLTGNGAVLPLGERSAATVVEAVLSVDGTKKTLRRCGMGSACVFAYGGLPCSRGEYEAAVEAICPGRWLDLLLEPAWFAEKLPKKEKRLLLGQLAGIPGGTVPPLPLLDRLRGKLEDNSPYALWGELISQLQLRKGALSDLPARYAECLALSREPDASDSVKRRLAQLREQAEVVNGELSELYLEKQVLERLLTQREDETRQRLEKLFSHTRFQLEKGGCRLFWGQIPYNDLCRRERHDLNMELLNALSCLLGVRLPVFLEDAQGFHGYRGQCICLQTLGEEEGFRNQNAKRKISPSL